MTRHEARILKHFSKSPFMQPIPKWVKERPALALKALGYLSVSIDFSQAFTTDEGYAALDEYRDLRSDRRWTRGLAVVALVISLFALLLELDDRGYLGGMFSALKSTQSVAQRSPD